MQPGRRSAWQSPCLALWVPLAAVVVALLVWAALPPQQALRLLHEGGPVERSTEILYFLLPLLLWSLRRPGDPVPAGLALSVLFLAFGAREMDLHKAWTGMSVLKVSFYLGDAPLRQKMVALAVVGLVALAAAFLFVRHARPLWRALLRREPVAVTIACFLVTMAVSKVFDRSISILAEDYGIFFAEPVHALVAALEEILELSLPLILALGLAQHRWLPRR